MKTLISRSCLLSSVLRKALTFSLPKFVHSSSSVSSYSAAEASPGISNFFSGQSQSDNEESLIYRHKLLCQRPSTIKWQKRLQNSVSFIGSVVFPLKIINSSRNFGVHTVLEVRLSNDSDRTFRILLKMWDEMAKLSLKHLKVNDEIYVSGYLDSYKKVGPSGKCRILYEVKVDEINYVACNGKSETSTSEPKEDIIPVSELKKKADSLYLWQVFFANPYEWWDNRKDKKNPRFPDFKHKDTGESLWLNSEDPPWVRRQLQLHDSKMAEQGLRGLVNSSSRSRISEWTFDE